MFMKCIVTCFIALLFFGSVSAQNKNEAALKLKINRIIKKMTLEEKIAMLHGNALFSSAGVPRLGIPELTCDDGPLGVREEIKRFDWASANWTTDSATFLPNGSAIAATWNPIMANKYGVVIGEEANARKKNVMLAPAFNICRMPLCGRTYEYYSEDPYLNSQLAIQSVKGIQSQHVAACIKHFAANNQELDRDSVNTIVDERALQEIYFPAFKAAVQQGNAYTVMSAYNKLNGYWCSENGYLLNKVLKGDWGFKGVVMSDWAGTHHTVAAANNGLDIEMGSSGPYDQWYLAKPLLAAVKAGEVSVKTIDDKVGRILWLMYHTSMSTNHPKGAIATPEHTKAAYDIASESIVLLKNDKQLLPLKTSEIKRIAVIGDNAVRTFALGGYGAGVKAKQEVTALEGIKSRFGKTADIRFAQGYRASYLASKTAEQNGDYNEPDQDLINEAVALAKSSDVAILCIGSNREYESEAHDRKSLELPFGEQALVNAVSAVNPNTIIIVMAGAPFDLNEIKKSNHTIVWSWFNGSEAGNALADVLKGTINPSGKLPFTFPASLNDSPAFNLNTYPGNNLTAEYKEGILVGYRWYDTKNIVPLFPFGYGLSYTDFFVSKLSTDKSIYKKDETIHAKFAIKNTGGRNGAEVVQLYVNDPVCSVQRPEKELKAFKKIFLKAGETKTIEMQVKAADLAFYDEAKKGWNTEAGEYVLELGNSSRNIILKTKIAVK
ncbi:glycoside hydrolase family 3 C-terminal domain-containing protein [Mucilaginibacter rubeus]|uniref:Glycoside hydrolase family 3 C-terminal domain-containing protein n=2 Tax=Mucilaginibacter rubeus TaxID=2027860 RepID=A0ABX7ULM7_9SPHI|nr:glycoside hydrolase family 3 C-terminal domain-containing protein [Mucilaginibacter rubeus]QTE53736.1 glycoside hydrolase family 3 C-terminal domain-containing protein [Mucilaginibacter rubeus]QTE60240.1 glycoside hydrolase family 3 C-terminal domain-containing protein [Mucilaginibacter rubeus]QTE66837.1 glycoside hydrolase family 3 C-terminal domain-containing protein [Mucilaginibacter rubeus]QTF65644.1 glycoside hydrolase family 3 C-terminal domain-containing protein [Mucilaginibacter rube